MNKFKNLEAVIFDLDGTLWDAVSSLTETYNIISDEMGYGHISEDMVRSLMGKTFDQVSEIIFPGSNDEEKKKIKEMLASLEGKVLREKKATRLFENVRETLEQIKKNTKVFIVSNCQKGYIESFADIHEMWSLIDDYENPGRTGLSKGENIKLIMDRNNIKKAIYIGDTQHDMESSNFAGIPFVLADYGFGKVQGAEYKITKVQELLDLIEFD